MISKVAKTLLQIRPARQMSYGFCSAKKPEAEQQQQEQKMEDDSEMKQGGRTSKPDQENENLRNKKEKINYSWQAWRVFVWGNFALLGYNLYLVSNKQRPEEQLGAIEVYMNSAKWIKRKYQESIDFFTKPPTKQLLQDIPFLPPGMDPPKTIVLNLSGTLIHSNYVFGKGTEVLKRPGLQNFLRQLSQQFEVVVFTNDDSMFTFELLSQLDPSHSIFSGGFGRESMVYEKGEYIKDLNYLNRDLSRVIVIDKDSKMLKYHTDNGIFLPEFSGDVDDKELHKLLPFLQHLARPDIKDVRKEISYYGNHNPSEKFLQELQVRHEQMKKKQSSGLSGIFGSNQARSPTYQKQYNQDKYD